MADTLKNIRIPANEWVNINDEVGFSAGTAFDVQNIGACDLYYTLCPQEPESPNTAPAFRIFDRGENVFVESTLWVWSSNTEGLVNPRLISAIGKFETSLIRQLHALFDSTGETNKQLRLLNIRIEEGFETLIEEGDEDVNHGN